MRLFLFAVALLLAGMLASATAARAADTRFWNLTSHTVNNFQMAPAGTTAFGPNLCLADKDKSVDSDERLKLAGIPSGRYDIKLADTTGRMCTVKNVEVTAGKVFSISEKELTGCTP